METKDIKLFPVSAKKGTGIEELKATIIHDCQTSVKEILEESTEKKLKDSVVKSIKQLDFYWKAMNMAYDELDERFQEISETMDAIKEKAHSYEGLFEMHLNEMKLQLSGKVMELFNMEYHYDIESLPSGLVTMDKDSFLVQVEALCSDLRDTLSRVLLYREENAYTVIRRINDINNLTKKLRRIRDELTSN